jgi:hypothetical protein
LTSSDSGTVRSMPSLTKFTEALPTGVKFAYDPA